MAQIELHAYSLGAFNAINMLIDWQTTTYDVGHSVEVKDGKRWERHLIWVERY